MIYLGLLVIVALACPALILSLVLLVAMALGAPVSVDMRGDK